MAALATPRVAFARRQRRRGPRPVVAQAARAATTKEKCCEGRWTYAPPSGGPGDAGAAPPCDGVCVEDAVGPAHLEGVGDAAFSRSVVLQAFSWESWTDARGHWNVLREQVPALRELGVTHVWLPPPSHSVSPQGYLPGRLYSLNSAYGSREELCALLDELNAHGLVPVADIVINHRCADGTDENGVYNMYSDDEDHDGRRIDWGAWAIAGDDVIFGGQGAPDSGADYAAAPDLDHTNASLRSALVDWLSYLQSLGFKGWRLDFVKGYAPEYAREYVDRTVGRNAFVVGELWSDLSWNNHVLCRNQDVPRQEIASWIAATGRPPAAAAFDFVLKGVLQEAVRHTQYDRLRDEHGKAPGLNGWLPQRSVTFIDNHDTGPPQSHWPFPPDGILLGYVYVLTHPGCPCIWLDHWAHFGIADELRVLIEARRRNGVTAESELLILAAEPDLYVAKILSDGGDDALVVKLGPRFEVGAELLPDPERFRLALSGRDFAVWERTEVGLCGE